MSKKIRKDNNAAIPALQPDFSKPVPHCTVQTVPDVAVEEVLFRSYLREKARADRLVIEVRYLRELLKETRRRRRMGRIKLKPSYNPNPKEQK